MPTAHVLRVLPDGSLPSTSLSRRARSWQRLDARPLPRSAADSMPRRQVGRHRVAITTFRGVELALISDGMPSIDGATALWGVDDIAATYAALLEAGAESLEPVLDVGGGVWVASVRDPFGNRVGLVENPHFDSAAVR